MTIAKLNEQHDYITLKVDFQNGETVNLTQSRRGIKASGKGVTNDQLRSLLKGFDEYGKAEKLSYGPKMQGLRAAATQCASVAAFIEKLGGPKALSVKEQREMDAIKALSAFYALDMAPSAAHAKAIATVKGE